MFLFDGENAAEKTFRFMEEKGRSGLWNLDIKSGSMWWSLGFFQLLGIEPGSIEPSYEILQTIIHPDDLRPAGELEIVLETAGTVSRDFRVILPSGRVRWLSGKGEILVDNDACPIRAIGMVFDVTHHYETKAAAEAFQARLKTLVKALSAATWSASATGQLTEATAWCELTGQSPRQAVKMGWLDSVHPDDRGRTERAWLAAIEGQNAYELEYSLRVKDGGYHRVRSRAVPLRDKNKKVREWVGLTIDIQSENNLTAPKKKPEYLTGAQLRAARAMLNWSVRDLAEHAHVSASTIRRLEEPDGAPKTTEPAMRMLEVTLEENGVEFLYPPDGTPGVRLAVRRKN